MEKTAVAIFRVNDFGKLGSPCIDVAVGDEWEVKDMTEQQGSVPEDGN